MQNDAGKEIKRTHYAVATSLILVIFCFGVLVGRYRVFPYQVLSSIKSLFAAPAPEFPLEGVSDTLQSSLFQLQKTLYAARNLIDLKGNGGGISTIGESIIGVDSRGRFFTYLGQGRINHLEIDIETNEDLFLDHINQHVSDEQLHRQMQAAFRVLDIAVKETPDKTVLFLSYVHWDNEKKGKTVRIARLALISSDLSAILDGTISVTSDAWGVIFDSHPLIDFDEASGFKFTSNHSGGRMIFDQGGNLLLGIGDHLLRHPDYIEPYPPQDEASSYGSFVRIDLNTLEAVTFAKGTRNPQGLLMDRDGNIWSTEHGPRGGDELNLIQEGRNYGWPIETYGTGYESYSWPLSGVQGRHPTFEKPIFAWAAAIAPSNLIQIKEMPEQWEGDLLVSSLKARSLFRLRIDDNRVILVEEVPIGERVRDIIQMQDGSFLLWTDGARFVELKIDPSEQVAGVTP